LQSKALISPQEAQCFQKMNFTFNQRAEGSFPEASMVHRLKSIGFPQREQVWDRLNSSEKISFSLPHSGQVQMKELKFLSSWNPGQCVGVLVFCGMLILLFF
jgi:hypothetical protein